MDRWGIAITAGGDVSDGAWVEAERRHDAFAVLQLEEPLDRLPVAGRGGHVRDPCGVGNAEAAEKDDRRAGAAGDRCQERVPLAETGRADVTYLFLTLHPAVSRDKHDGVLGHDEVVGAVLNLLLGALDQAPSRVCLGLAIRLLHLADLVPHQRPPLRVLPEQPVDLPGTPALGCQLLTDDQDLELGQPIDLQLEDGVGLLRVECEACHDFGGCVRLAVGPAHDPQYLVQGIEDNREPLEHVDATVERGELVLETPGHDVESEPQEMPQQLMQIQSFRPADLRLLGGHETGQVHREVGL